MRKESPFIYKGSTQPNLHLPGKQPSAPFHYGKPPILTRTSGVFTKKNQIWTRASLFASDHKTHPLKSIANPVFRSDHIYLSWSFTFLIQCLWAPYHYCASRLSLRCPCEWFGSVYLMQMMVEDWWVCLLNVVHRSPRSQGVQTIDSSLGFAAVARIRRRVSLHTPANLTVKHQSLITIQTHSPANQREMLTVRNQAPLNPAQSPQKLCFEPSFFSRLIAWLS